MSGIQAAPPPPPAAPASPVAAPPPGGGAPVGGKPPAEVSFGLGATKGAGGTGGGGGGNSATAQEERSREEIEEELSLLGLDRTAESTLNVLGAVANGTITMQAAMNHLQKNTEAAATPKRSSDAAAFRRALNRSGLRFGAATGLIAPQLLAATVSALESLRDMSAPEAAFGGLGAPPVVLALTPDLAAEAIDDTPRTRGRQRGELDPALPLRDVDLAAELRPRTPGDELHLHELVTDPRAGFAPEGVVAWNAERKKRIRLQRSLQGRNDFTEAGNGARWWVVVANSEEQSPAILRRAAREADLAGINLLIDAQPAATSMKIGSAVRDLSTAHPKVRFHFASSAA